MGSELALHVPNRLEDDLADILGLGEDRPRAKSRPGRRLGLPVLAAGLLATAAFVAFFAVDRAPRLTGRSPAGADRRDAGLARDAAPPPIARDSDDPGYAEKLPGDAPPAPVAREAPTPAAPVPADRTGERTAIATAADPAASRRRVDDASTAAATPALIDPPRPADAAVVPVESPAAPAAPRVEEVRAARPVPPPDRQQIAAANLPAAVQPATAYGESGEQPRRPPPARPEERKVLDSLDAIRLLRRQ